MDKAPDNTQMIIKLAVVCLLPMLACSTYYTLEKLQSASTWLYVMAALALPLSLIGASVATSILSANKPRGPLFWAAVAAFSGPMLMLAKVWS